MEKEQIDEINEVLRKHGDDFWKENDWIFEEMLEILAIGGIGLESHDLG